MTQRKYSIISTVLSAAIATLVMLLPFGIVVVAHPGFTTAVLDRLITESPQHFWLLIFYILVASLSGWYYTKLRPANQIPENSQ